MTNRNRLRARMYYQGSKSGVPPASNELVKISLLLLLTPSEKRDLLGVLR